MDLCQEERCVFDSHIWIACLLLFSGIAVAADDAPLLATRPTISKTEIAFVYGGYLRAVGESGSGDARSVEEKPGGDSGASGVSGLSEEVIRLAVISKNKH